MLLHAVLRPCRPLGRGLQRCRFLSTLPNHPHIYVFPSQQAPGTSLLTLLPTSPPTASLAIGTTTSDPPTPSTFQENPQFLGILQSVLAAHATYDPYVQSQATAFASSGGSTLGSGGMIFSANHPSQQYRRKEKRSKGVVIEKSGGGGAGGASGQGGSGGGGRGGWVHVSDQRNPPDYGRIAWPEDIFGSVEVDNTGAFVGANGNYQSSGTYRVITREGILGLSPFLLKKLVERLTDLERDAR